MLLNCGHEAVATSAVTNGIARRASDNATMCYDCADAMQRMDFSQAEEFTAYVDSVSFALTTWSGGILAKYVPSAGGISRSGWNGSKIYSWRFVAPDGSHWYGRNGGTGMVINVRKAKVSK